MEVIHQVQRQKGKVRMTIGNQTVVVPLGLYRERPLQEGEEIDLEAYDQWLLLRQYRYALDRAVGYLSMRSHSKKEIADKLLRIGYRPATVEMVLYKLDTAGVMDDADFARQWVEARANRKVGTRRMMQELHQKGIDRETAEEAVAALPTEALQEAANALAKKAWQKRKPTEDPRKVANRVLAMLSRRGFDWPMAKAALAYARQEDEEKEWEE